MDDVATTVEGPAVAPSRCPVDHSGAMAPPVVEPVESVDPAGAARCPVDHAAIAAERDGRVGERSAADLRMRKLLRLAPDAPRMSLVDAHNAFSRSVFVSGVRCTFTYVALPLLAPIVGLSGAFGPIITILLSVVSVTAIIISARRFFGSDHPWRWVHAVIGAALITILTVSAILDVLNLANVI